MLGGKGFPRRARIYVLYASNVAYFGDQRKLQRRQPMNCFERKLETQETVYLNKNVANIQIYKTIKPFGAIFGFRCKRSC